ncbi:precorrin-3B synthase [Bradyrhizobium sp. BWA-3-5]|uniref:precorrin-3B synthase n=1 Tax=Bradyrhizobium sp. BWA-3-5 TaxID=3080013 RepID=UPI00293EF5B9|nr:precorrin-3B synthase [Bradyrhizobium sp. BWA-3-5]WOH64145.1 precorrin-3B synthase [Bradyrhizobium sp. BWA-3-5]WOH64262.1 precorrin-3B synthase [Bradyrhizobium sp. BWA-3-5]WOH70190.1 precorrin-3B synthase [Bradyrhizobium sp. BWA-3-5]
MSAFAIKGWCPGALRPMRSGDGLVVRIRPHRGRLDGKQAAGIGALAKRYGNGLIDLTSRGNLQIRGVSDEGHRPLIEELSQLRLIDPDPEWEARRNILVTPFWTAGDDTCSLATELEQGLAKGPPGLPTKFGFAVDCGMERVLATASADIRVERSLAGELIVRADGAEHGHPVTRRDAIKVSLALAEWFVTSGGARGWRGRMAAYIRAGAKLPDTLRGHVGPARMIAEPCPRLYPQGAMVGAAFGQVTHAALSDLAGCSSGLRMTPWRMILAEDLREMPGCEGLITQVDHPMLRVVACSGAPACREAHADIRTFAAALAPHIAPDSRLHVSGCAKGCAHSGPASITLVATRDGFDLVRGGSTREAPTLRGLSAARMIADPSVLTGER